MSEPPAESTPTGSEPDAAAVDSDNPNPEPEPASESVQSTEQDTFALGRSDQMVAAVLAAVVILLGVLQWGRLSGWGVDPIEIGELPPVENTFQLDVNTATEIEWAQLDGIGEVLAERIAVDRATNGNFRSIDDLNRVEGIGPQTLERIRKWLTIKPSK